MTQCQYVIVQHSPLDNCVDRVIGPFNSWDEAKAFTNALDPEETDQDDLQIEPLVSSDEI